MRIDEDKIWTVYMESKSLVTEKKGLPPWLKDKKGEKEEKSEKSDKEEKGKGKKGKKGKKGLPPWLKGKGKKPVKESFETNGPSSNPEQEASNADETSEYTENITITLTPEEVSYLGDILSDFISNSRDDSEVSNSPILQSIMDKLEGGNSLEGMQDIGDINDLDTDEDLDSDEPLSDQSSSYGEDGDIHNRG
ncbi:MAG: hypothetical protein PHS54_00590 [Clostridia bacterium]|nr:hypothetical protein [Clostridia bacterium]